MIPKEIESGRSGGIRCAGNLEPFMVPKHVEFLDTLPKNPSGKVDAKTLGKGMVGSVI